MKWVHAIVSLLLLAVGAFASLRAWAIWQSHEAHKAALSSMHKNNFSDARDLLQLSLSRHPGNGRARVDLVNLLYEEYVVKSSRFRGSDSSLLEYALLRGETKDMSSLFPLADSPWPEVLIAELNTAERRYQGAPLYILRAQCRMLTGDLRGAEEDLRRYAVYEPKDESVHRSLGRCLYQRGLQAMAAGTTTEAEELFAAALEEDPQSPYSNAALGFLALDRKQFEPASGYFREALRFKPLAIGARMGLAESLLAQERFAEAARQVEKLAIRLSPLSDGGLVHEQAFALARKLVEEHPSAPALAAALKLARMRSDWDAVRALLASGEASGTSLNPAVTALYRTYLLVYDRQYEQAWAELGALLQMAPRHRPAWQLARYLEGLSPETQPEDFPAEPADLSPRNAMQVLVTVEEKAS